MGQHHLPKNKFYKLAESAHFITTPNNKNNIVKITKRQIENIYKAGRLKIYLNDTIV